MKKSLTQKNTRQVQKQNAQVTTSSEKKNPTDASPKKLDIGDPVVAFNVIGRMVNQANQRGVYDLSESATIFQCLQTVGSYINRTITSSNP